MATEVITHFKGTDAAHVLLQMPRRSRTGFRTEVIELPLENPSSGCLRGILFALAIEWTFVAFVVLVREAWRFLR